PGRDVWQELQGQEVEGRLERARGVEVAIELAKGERAAKREAQLAHEDQQQPALDADARAEPATQAGDRDPPAPGIRGGLGRGERGPRWLNESRDVAHAETSLMPK